MSWDKPGRFSIQTAKRASQGFDYQMSKTEYQTPAKNVRKKNDKGPKDKGARSVEWEKTEDSHGALCKAILWRFLATVSTFKLSVSVCHLATNLGGNHDHSGKVLAGTWLSSRPYALYLVSCISCIGRNGGNWIGIKVTQCPVRVRTCYITITYTRCSKFHRSRALLLINLPVTLVFINKESLDVTVELCIHKEWYVFTNNTRNGCHKQSMGGKTRFINARSWMM